MTVLTTAEGTVGILELPSGRCKITLKPHDRNLFIPRASCETGLPLDVITSFLDRSFPWLCEVLARYDDPDYVTKVLSDQLFAYFDAPNFRGKRLLDFGCGAGASTLHMCGVLPETEVVGVDLEASNIKLARVVAAARNLSNVKFLVSPDPNSLPPEIGSFDFIMLSAVYEHLLPDERRRVMPLIWSSLNRGGVLFVNQTPYRYFPFEHHSTGLWFINYFPDKVSLLCARKLSKINPKGNKSPDWNVHLRGGIRGGTEAQILRNLRLAGTGTPSVIQPKRQSRASYWLSCTNQMRHRQIKRLIATVFALTDKFLGTVPSMNLDVAIRKDLI